MIIRHEQPADIDTITKITKVAFKNHPCSQQIQHFIIRDLRASDALTISLVTEINGRVVGHLAFPPSQFLMVQQTGTALDQYLYCQNFRDAK